MQQNWNWTNGTNGTCKPICPRYRGSCVKFDHSNERRTNAEQTLNERERNTCSGFSQFRIRKTAIKRTIQNTSPCEVHVFWMIHFYRSTEILRLTWNWLVWEWKGTQEEVKVNATAFVHETDIGKTGSCFPLCLLELLEDGPRLENLCHSNQFRRISVNI